MEVWDGVGVGVPFGTALATPCTGIAFNPYLHVLTLLMRLT